MLNLPACLQDKCKMLLCIVLVIFRPVFIMEETRNFKEKGDASMIQHVSCMVYCLKKARHEIQSIL